jgi:hypothetical protein
LESLGWIGEGEMGDILERRRREFFLSKPRERKKKKL